MRVSSFDNQERRQTPFVMVEVIPLVKSTDRIDIPDSELKVDVLHSPGPGSQSVNTTDPVVRTIYIPTSIVVSM